MTEKELELLSAAKEKYWLYFSALVSATLQSVPEHLRAHLAAMLQEASSVYGRKRLS